MQTIPKGEGQMKNGIKFEDALLIAIAIGLVLFNVWSILNPPKPAPPVPLNQALVVRPVVVGANECVVTVIHGTKPAYVALGTYVLAQADLAFRNPGRFINGQMLYEDNGFWGKNPYGFVSTFTKVTADCQDIDLSIREVNGN